MTFRASPCIIPCRHASKV